MPKYKMEKVGKTYIYLFTCANNVPCTKKCTTEY